MLFYTFSTKAAEASLDALWKKTQVITNNLANVDTPGYKAQHVNFSQVMKKVSQQQQQEAARRNAQGVQEQNPQQNIRVTGNNGNGVATGDAVYRTSITTESDTSVRTDGNNVSVESEQAELWKSYAQYSYLLDRMSGHYSSISTAIGNMRT